MTPPKAPAAPADAGAPDAPAAPPAPAAGRAPGAPAARRYQTKKDTHTFKSCNDAVRFIKTAPQTAEADAHISPKLSAQTSSKRADGSWQTSADVSWGPDPGQSVMTVPDWSWPNMTRAERDALGAFTAAITVHEQGHFSVADKVARDAAATITGTGADASAARKDLKAKLDDYREQTGKALDEATNAYDAATRHGASQSQGPATGYPGGNDAVLTCP